MQLLVKKLNRVIFTRAPTAKALPCRYCHPQSTRKLLIPPPNSNVLKSFSPAEKGV